MPQMRVDGVLTLAGLATIVLVGYQSIQPGGRVAVWQAERAARNARAVAVGEAWSDLARVGQILGKQEADDIVVEVSDYECPYCRRTHPNVAEWLDSNPDAAILYVHLPLPSHPFAAEAAAAGICAEPLGLFQTLHDALMVEEGWRRDGGVVELVASIGIADTVAFAGCMQSARVVERIAEGARIATALGVAGTPTFLNRRGQMHLGGAEQRDLTSLR